MKINHIAEVIGEVGNGITEPLYCTMDDGTNVIFKVRNNPEGNKVLVNEFICLNIAKKLSLPIPDGGLAEVDDATIVSCSKLSIPFNNGIGFYSVRLNHVTTGICDMKSEFIQKYCKNSQDFIPIILFDHLIYNNDRNNGNALLDLKKKQIHIIDNSHCFYLGSIWDSIQLERCILEEDFRHNTIVKGNKIFYNKLISIFDLDRNMLYKEADLFKSLITEEFLDNIFNEIPIQWQIEKNDLCSLKKYIKYRLNNLSSMCDVIYDNWEVI